ncbi:MAG: ferredoxin, partial [Gemmatimonadota bacterium]
ADWAATEGRFRKHFRPIPADSDDDYMPFHVYFDLSADERENHKPFVYTLQDDRRLDRLSVSDEIVALAEDRQLFWSQLKELAGLDTENLEAEFEARADEIRAEYESRMSELKATYPKVVARQLAAGLLSAGDGSRTIEDLLQAAASAPPVVFDPALSPDMPGSDGRGPAAPAAVVEQAAVVATPAATAEPEAEDNEDDLAMPPYIETALCTTCDDCLNINKKLFAYDDNKQAYIKDASAGTFAQLVKAAEKCPAAIIHPGTPINPKEKDLEKWIERARPFN